MRIRNRAYRSVRCPHRRWCQSRDSAPSRLSKERSDLWSFTPLQIDKYQFWCTNEISLINIIHSAYLFQAWPVSSYRKKGNRNWEIKDQLGHLHNHPASCSAWSRSTVCNATFSAVANENLSEYKCASSWKGAELLTVSPVDSSSVCLDPVRASASQDTCRRRSDQRRSKSKFEFALYLWGIQKSN